MESVGKKKKRKTKLTNLSTKKRPKGNDFTGKIPPNIYRRIINTNPSKTLQKKKIQEEGILSNLFFEARITFIPMPEEDITTKENSKLIYFMNIYSKFLNKMLANQI